MRTSTILLATLCGSLWFGSSEADASPRDWPNPFGWMKKKLKDPPPPPVVRPPVVVVPPPPPVVVTPPRPPVIIVPPPVMPPPPGPPTPSNPPGPPSPPPSNGGPQPGGPPTSGPSNPAPPTTGGATGGADPGPAASAHVHLYRDARVEVTEPARYERIPAGLDKFGVPHFENKLVSPERRVWKTVKKCSCGAEAS